MRKFDIRKEGDKFIVSITVGGDTILTQIIPEYELIPLIQPFFVQAWNEPVVIKEDSQKTIEELFHGMLHENQREFLIKNCSQHIDKFKD